MREITGNSATQFFPIIKTSREGSLSQFVIFLKFWWNCLHTLKSYVYWTISFLISLITAILGAFWTRNRGDGVNLTINFPTLFMCNFINIIYLGKNFHFFYQDNFHFSSSLLNHIEAVSRVDTLTCLLHKNTVLLELNYGKQFHEAGL